MRRKTAVSDSTMQFTEEQAAEVKEWVVKKLEHMYVEIHHHGHLSIPLSQTSSPALQEDLDSSRMTVLAMRVFLFLFLFLILRSPYMRFVSAISIVL